MRACARARPCVWSDVFYLLFFFLVRSGTALTFRIVVGVIPLYPSILPPICFILFIQIFTFGIFLASSACAQKLLHPSSSKQWRVVMFDLNFVNCIYRERTEETYSISKPIAKANRTMTMGTNCQPTDLRLHISCTPNMQLKKVPVVCSMLVIFSGCAGFSFKCPIHTGCHLIKSVTPNYSSKVFLHWPIQRSDSSAILSSNDILHA